MTKEDLLKRVTELQRQVEDSAAAHNSLHGRYLEALELYNAMCSSEENIAEPLKSEDDKPVSLSIPKKKK